MGDNGFAVALAVALALGLAIYWVRSIAQFNHNRRAIARAVAYDKYSAESRANLDRDASRYERAVNREAGRRSIQRPDGHGRSGRHAADGDAVLEPETAVA